jgi:NTP pyrophosphatase (non-canonical NTP hydrolase)
MVELKKLQEEVIKNKVSKGFNIKDLNLEFLLAYGELAEAFNAYQNKEEDLGEELADVVIYILGIAEMLDIDLEVELLKKIEKNKRRKYIKKEDGKWIKIEG